MDLQPLFDEKIISIEELSPGYENHSSDVWLVKTVEKEVIVRASRSVNEKDGAFWGGCRYVFGINPRNVHALEAVNNVLSDISSIRIPRIIGKGFIDREYVIVEKLEGKMVQSFIGQPRELLYSLGEGLAQIHKSQMNYVGNPLGTFRTELENFHDHIIKAMINMVNEYYSDNEKIVAKLPEISKVLQNMEPPRSGSFILVDMDPTQFFTNGKIVTGLVDTEAYVIGPRELDFIALEYVLDQKSADDFIDGYESVLDVPALSHCRLPYRYLYRLIEIQGRDDLDKWLNRPILFKSGSEERDDKTG